ncbi:MAG: hypothetical protein M1825_001267, partial [Sarcosagium campestre]
MANSLEPFQEWPQLLDPHLALILPPLVSAYLDRVISVSDRGGHPEIVPSLETPSSEKQGTDSIPAERGISQLLYTLCKIRGQDVVTNFLSNEPRYLEPFLSAFQYWNTLRRQGERDGEETPLAMSWVERYIILLWLSHLLLIPFDLASVSPMQDSDDEDEIPGLRLPPSLPRIVRQLIPIGVHYLGSSGKERESAKTLLVRLSTRSDMQQLGLLKSLVDWALRALSPEASSVLTSTYQHHGILAYIASLLSSCRFLAVRSYILPFFETAQRISIDSSQYYEQMRSSAVVRRTLIKILRNSILITLQRSQELSDDGSLAIQSELLEDVIEHLLGALADSDSPVRFAASKSLSIITFRLDAAMAAEIVDAVLGSLAEGVFWEDAATGRQLTNSETISAGAASLRKNINAVNPVRWHGLTLTLAHLLYRRSAPAQQLPDILNALILALTFEQRSSTGVSLGGNVRDAACFGVWALSRRYSTEELLDVKVADIKAAKHLSNKAVSVQQLLTLELVSAAALDPVGNIRRGSSAALQELIGRHPNTVTCGISLVQVVDYHAISLRHSAIVNVAVGTANLEEIYWLSLLEDLLGWRGIGSPDAASRRAASEAIGLFSRSHRSFPAIERPKIFAVRKCINALDALPARSVESRHGLLLSLAAVIGDQQMSREGFGKAEMANDAEHDIEIIRMALAVQGKILDGDYINHSLRPELTSEASCTLVGAVSYAIYAVRLMTESEHAPLMLQVVDQLIETGARTLLLSLSRNEDEVIDAACTAAQRLFHLIDRDRRADLVMAWLGVLKQDDPARRRRSSHRTGFIKVLGAVFALIRSDDVSSPSPQQDDIVRNLILAASTGNDISIRVAAIRALGVGPISCRVVNESIVKTLSDSLDDYTIDSRGDVGSLVRLEALDAVVIMRDQNLLSASVGAGPVELLLLPRLARLSAEKLDKVRIRAWECLGPILGQRHPTVFSNVLESSMFDHFNQILRILSVTGLAGIQVGLLSGYVTSAGVGSESVLRASRSALVEFVRRAPTAFTQGQDGFSSGSFAAMILQVLRLSNDSAERLSVPTLEVIAFLFDAGAFQMMLDQGLELVRSDEKF